MYFTQWNVCGKPICGLQAVCEGEGDRCDGPEADRAVLWRGPLQGSPCLPVRHSPQSQSQYGNECRLTQVLKTPLLSHTGLFQWGPAFRDKIPTLFSARHKARVIQGIIQHLFTLIPFHLWWGNEMPEKGIWQIICPALMAMSNLPLINRFHIKVACKLFFISWNNFKGYLKRSPAPRASLMRVWGL